MRKVLLTATVQSHIAQFHKPLIKLLQDKGYEVHVAARDNLSEKNGLSLKEPDKVFDVSFERSPFNRRNINAFRQLRDILSKNDYSVVHCNTPVGGVLTRLAANKYRKKGIKVFYTAHGFHFYKGSSLKNWFIYYPIEKLMANFTDKLITIVEEDYTLAASRFKTEVKRIHGVGANAKKYSRIPHKDKEELKKLMGFNEEDFLILCTGELNENKNQATVIEAVAKVVKEFPHVMLLLAGNGPLDGYLKELGRKLNVEEAIHFLGYRTDLDRFVKISDLVVSASKREGLGLNIIEAMLCQKATIASKNRGHNELITHGMTGSLVDCKDVDGFVNEIRKYLMHQDIKEEVAKKGYLSIQKYTDTHVIKELEKIYMDIH